MYIKELWRYPVKSMAGERLMQVQMGGLGLEGDRKVLVLGPSGRVATHERTHACWACGERWGRTASP